MECGNHIRLIALHTTFHSAEYNFVDLTQVGYRGNEKENGKDAGGAMYLNDASV